MHRHLRHPGGRGPRYLLRSEAGELIGLFARGAEPMRLYAAPLVPGSGAHPLARLDFFDSDGRLLVADAQKAPARIGRTLNLARLFELPDRHPDRMIAGALYRSLRSTNAIENLNGSVVSFCRNVRWWRDGSMLLRRIGASLRETQNKFRRLKGSRHEASHRCSRSPN